MTVAGPGVSATETVQLKVPGLPQYLGVVRLTVAGLANKLDVPFDDAEDLKLAVTEVCSHILRGARVRVDLQIEFRFSHRQFEVVVTSAATEPRQTLGPSLLREFGRDLDPEVGMSLVEALMDRLETTTNDETGEMSITMARALDVR